MEKMDKKEILKVVAVVLASVLLGTIGYLLLNRQEEVVIVEELPVVEEVVEEGEITEEAAEDVVEEEVVEEVKEELIAEEVEV